MRAAPEIDPEAEIPVISVNCAEDRLVVVEGRVPDQRAIGEDPDILSGLQVAVSAELVAPRAAAQVPAFIGQAMSPIWNPARPTIEVG